MGWESVPWMVGGGAEHSAEVGRAMAFAGVEGVEGIVGSGDLKVTQLGTPGASVNVAVGTALIPCRAASQLNQSYIGRMLSQDTVGVAATGGAVRYDMVVARVEDPWLSGEPWADPGVAAVGPYIFTRVISGVAQANIASNAAAKAYLAAQGFSAIPLAGISMPVTTTNVLTGYINDLRAIGRPKRERNMYTDNPVAPASVTATTMADWFLSKTVVIPTWATRAVLVFHVGSAKHSRLSASVAGTAFGEIAVQLGAQTTQVIKFDLETSINDANGRYSFVGGDTLAIASGIRGTTVTLKIRAHKDASAGGNVALSVDTSSFGYVDLEFQQLAE